MSYYIRSYDIISSCVMFDFIKIHLITLHFISFYFISFHFILLGGRANYCATTNVIDNFYKKIIRIRKIPTKYKINHTISNQIKL